MISLQTFPINNLIFFRSKYNRISFFYHTTFCKADDKY